VDRGYIKIWRKTLESEVFADPTLFKLWSYCLLKANHKSNFVSVDGIARPIKIEPGEFITGRYQLHKEFYPKKRKNNKSPLTLWRKLEILKNMRNLNIKTMSKCSIISIINWKDYQQNEQQMNITRTSREHHVNTNKNVKNVKNDKNKHLDYVFLKTEEHEKLIKDYGKDVIEKCIEELDNYIGAMPKKRNKYTDHNRVIRGWVIERVLEKKGITPKQPKSQYKEISICPKCGGVKEEGVCLSCV